MKILANNKKALFNYELIKDFEAGMVLLGWEVKAIKEGRASIKEGFIDVVDGEVWLKGAHINPFKQADKFAGVDEYRKRKLLLNREEITKLATGQKIKGNTIVPLRIIHLRRRIKIIIALAKGMKKYYKREKLQEKDLKRQIDRDLKESRF
ncbi:MAG: SsrA-binding protein SmpB [bacterium]